MLGTLEFSPDTCKASQVLALSMPAMSTDQGLVLQRLHTVRRSDIRCRGLFQQPADWAGNGCYVGRFNRPRGVGRAIARSRSGAVRGRIAHSRRDWWHAIMANLAAALMSERAAPRLCVWPGYAAPVPMMSACISVANWPGAWFG
jgi:hypothetical protein